VVGTQDKKSSEDMTLICTAMF